MRSVSPNARRAAMDSCFVVCVNTIMSPALSAVMLMSSPSSFPRKPMPKLSSANPAAVATFRRRSFAVSSTSTSTTYVRPSNPSMLSSIGTLCGFCCDKEGKSCGKRLADEIGIIADRFINPLVYPFFPYVGGCTWVKSGKNPQTRRERRGQGR